MRAHLRTSACPKRKNPPESGLGRTPLSSVRTPPEEPNQHFIVNDLSVAGSTLLAVLTDYYIAQFCFKRHA